MRPHDSDGKSVARRRTNPWTLFVFGALLFMGIVNVLLLRASLGVSRSTFSATPYEDGLAFQERIDARTRFNSLGLKVISELTSQSDFSHRLILKLLDSSGRPITGVRIIAYLSRADSPQFDQKLELLPDGRQYLSSVNGPSGIWQVHLLILFEDSKVETDLTVRSS